jgi:hypothetical protein
MDGQGHTPFLWGCSRGLGFPVAFKGICLKTANISHCPSKPKLGLMNNRPY